MSHGFVPGAVDRDEPDQRSRGITCGLPREAHDWVCPEICGPVCDRSGCPHESAGV
jgi:hypothetical protein